MARTAEVLLPTEPNATKARLLYLGTSEERGSRLMYLQSIKSGVLEAIGGEDSYLAEAYHAYESESAADLAEATLGEHLDFIVAPPSTRPDLYEPHFTAIAAAHPEAQDLSVHFHRNPAVRSGTSRSTSTLAAAVSCSLPEGEAADEPRHLLVVDDVYAGGHTAAVIAQVVASWTGGGLDVLVACPLWVTGRLDPEPTDDGRGRASHTG